MVHRMKRTDAGNPHVRLYEGDVAPAATPRRRSLLDKKLLMPVLAVLMAMPLMAYQYIYVATEKVDGYTWTYARVRSTDLGIPDSNTVGIYNKVLYSGGSYFDTAVSPKPVGHVTIPYSLGGYIVTRLGTRALYSCSEMSGVTIPYGMESIGAEAFKSCRGLTSVEIPDNVREIEDRAFHGCNGLTSVKIGKNVSSIGDWAFYNCSGLTGVTIPDSVSNISDGMFDGCSGLTRVEIGAGVTNIGQFAFSGCSGLISVTIPDSVRSIRQEAFKGCSGLTSILVGNGVTEIAVNAFSGSNLTTIFFRGNAPRFTPELPPSCVVKVLPGSTGWGVDIPGTWNGMRIEYVAGYTVTYKPGSYSSGLEYASSEVAGQPLTLRGITYSRAGYTQNGWTTHDGGAKEYDLGSFYTLNADGTLYPSWSPNTYTVTLEANGGRVDGQSYTSAQVVYGKNTSQAAAHRTVVRDGYILLGWFDTSATSGGNMVFDANGYAVNGIYWNGSYSPGVSSATWKLSGNATVYARWMVDSGKYTLTLNANGGTVSGQSSVSVQVEKGKYTNQAAANRSVSRTGYTLAGWYDTSAASGGNIVFDANGYAANGTYWNGSYSPGSSSATWKYAGGVTAYARWTPVKYTVTLNANGGTVGGQQSVSFQVEYGKYTMQAGANRTVSRTGYTLVGWYDTNAASGGNMVFNAKGYAADGKYWNGSYSPSVSSATWKHGGGVTAYARWTPAKYTVTLNANGGTVSGQQSFSFQVDYGKYTMQAGANRTVSRSGHTLVGWYDREGNMVFDARGFAVNGKYWNGAYSPSVSSATWKYGGGVAAYARWVVTPPSRVVTFDANGGSISNEQYNCVVVESGKYTMQAGASGTKVTRDGYTLAGWYDTNATSGGNMVFDARGYAVDGKYWNGSYSPGVSSATWKYEGNVTAFARWTKNTVKYTVALIANGGNINGQSSLSVQVEQGKYTMQAGANRTVSRTGFALVGWYDTSASSGGNMVFDARGFAVNGKYWNGAYSPGVSSATWKYAGGVAAYARWVVSPPSRVVTFDANGGAISNEQYNCVVVEDGKYTMQAGASGTKVTREGYTLAGWYDTSAASGGNMVFDARGYAVNGKYWNGEYSPKVSSAMWKFSGNVTAYARWTKDPEKYTVTLNANDGCFDGGQTSVSVQVEPGKTSGQSAADRVVTPPRGYALVGWYDAKTGGDMVFDAMGYAVDGKYWNGSYWPSYSSAKWKYEGSVTLYARWVQVQVASSVRSMSGFGIGQGNSDSFAPGELVGSFADDDGRFMLTLDEGLATAYFVTWAEDGGVACECEAAVAGDVLILTTETGGVYHLVWDEDCLVATRIE